MNKSEGGLRKEERGFPKAWKKDDLGRLIAETKTTFKTDDLSQKVQVWPLTWAGGTSRSEVQT